MFNGLIFKRFTDVKQRFTMTMHKGFMIKEKVHKWHCSKFQGPCGRQCTLFQDSDWHLQPTHLQDDPASSCTAAGWTLVTESVIKAVSPSRMKTLCAIGVILDGNLPGESILSKLPRAMESGQSTYELRSCCVRSSCNPRDRQQLSHNGTQTKTTGTHHQFIATTTFTSLSIYL